MSHPYRIPLVILVVTLFSGLVLALAIEKLHLRLQRARLVIV